MCRRPIIPLSAFLLPAFTAPSIAAQPTPTTGPASVKEVTVAAV